MLLTAALSLLSASALNTTAMPKRSVGLYVLLADDTVPGYTSKDSWTPALFPYQQQGANVLYFSFIHPGTMNVPPAFATLAKSRASGGIPSSTKIIFAIGGYSYSISPNPWNWLTSVSAAESMASEVATWPSKYGCDGIDLDIETGAGDAPGVGPNLIAFIRALKQKNPSMIVTQPVFGYPQVEAENYVVNLSWEPSTKSNGLADGVGIMVYTGTGSLDYVKNYANGTDQWQGFPIKTRVPSGSVVCGMGGDASSNDILAMADAVKNRNLGGLMVWYASVIDTKTGKSAFQYAGGQPDASNKPTTQTWADALRRMQ